MDLKARLLDAGLSVAEVARKAGLPPSHLYNLLNRKRRPRIRLALRLEAATGGLIKWTEWFPEIQEAHKEVA